MKKNLTNWYLVNKVMDKTGWSKETTIRRMDNARKKGISYLTYLSTNFWLLKKDEKKYLYSISKKNKKRNQRINEVCKLANWEKPKALKEMIKARNEFNISFYQFKKNKLYNCSQDKRDEFYDSVMQCGDGDYGFHKYEKKLKRARDKYELEQLSNLSNQKPLNPTIEIGEPRYKKDKKTGAYIQTKDIVNNGTTNIMLAGDLMCRFEQQKAPLMKYGQFNFRDMFPYMKGIVSSSDLLIGNLETTLSESAKYTYELNRNDGNLNRNAPSTILDAVKDMGFDMAVTANNHCLDGGLTGVFQTVAHLEQYGLMHTGTFLGEKDRKENPFTMINVNGIKIAILGYTYGTNSRSKKLKKPATKYFVNLYRKAKAEKDIAEAKEAGAEFVIVYMHWGKEFSNGISEKQLIKAKEVADAGADFIAGSHPHVMEPFGYVTNESGKKIPVIYSMGNFISSMVKTTDCRDSVIINLKLVREGNDIKIRDISYIPCYTCIKYDDLDYTTLPLTDSLCKDNDELTEARKRIEKTIGTEIEQSELMETFEPVKEQFELKENNAPIFGEKVAKIAKASGKDPLEIVHHMDYCRKEYNMRESDYELLRAWELSDDDLKGFKKSKKSKEKKVQRTMEKLLSITGWDEEYAENELKRIKEKFGLGIMGYFLGEYYLLNDKEIEEKLEKQRQEKEERIGRVMQKSGWDRKKVLEHTRFFRKFYRLSMVDYELMRGWEMTKDDLEKCSTLITSNQISKKYNLAEGNKIAKNKITFDKVFKDYINRKFWINEQGATFESFVEFAQGLDHIFVKPINLQQGRGMKKMKLSDYDLKELYEGFMDRPLVLVEECVKQCKELNDLYDNSINTIRLITVNDNGEYKVIASFFRSGAFGSIVDNMGSGGLIAGVDETTGIVATGALDNKGNIYYEHPDTGKKIKGRKLPMFEEAKKLAIEALKKDERLNYVGWDIAICEDKPIVIEANTYPDLGAYQVPFWAEFKKGMKYKFEKYL